jgi:hypothetical protein
VAQETGNHVSESSNSILPFFLILVGTAMAIELLARFLKSKLLNQSDAASIEAVIRALADCKEASKTKTQLRQHKKFLSRWENLIAIANQVEAKELELSGEEEMVILKRKINKVYVESKKRRFNKRQLQARLLRTLDNLGIDIETPAIRAWVQSEGEVSFDFSKNWERNIEPEAQARVALVKLFSIGEDSKGQLTGNDIKTRLNERSLQDIERRVVRRLRS